MAVDYCEVTKKLVDTLCNLMEGLECDACSCEDGEGILLANGPHVVTFKTEFKPVEVYVSVSPQGVPVCSGSQTTVATHLLDDGFVLYAQVAEDSVVVRWIVKG